MEKPLFIPQEMKESEPNHPSVSIVETEFEGFCEEENCGPFTDRKIVVSLLGEEVQSFFHDDHLGHEEFETRDVEDYIIEHLGISGEELATLAATRDRLEKELEEVYDTDDEPDWEKESQLLAEQDTSFFTFLQNLGYEVTYTKEVQSYEESYREPDYYDEFEEYED